MVTFHHPGPNYSSRCILVRDIPDFDKRGDQGGALRVTIYYDGQSNADKGIALDHHVMPLLKAAPDLLAACEGAAEWLEGFASAEPYLSILREAIAKARGEVDVTALGYRDPSALTMHKRGEERVTVEAPNRTDYRCPKCGGDNVEASGTMTWDRAAQAWKVETVWAAIDCHDCGHNAEHPDAFKVEA